MLLLEQIAVLAAQRHDMAHVDLVEGRQHGGGVLRVLQPARDGLAQPRHAHALLARGVVGRRRRADLNRGGGRRHRGRLRGGAFDRGKHVAFGDAAVLARAGHGGGVEAGFGGELAHRRRQRARRLLPAWRRRGAAAGLARGARRRGFGFGACGLGAARRHLP